MPKKPKTIRVIIYRTKHKSQPYRVDIDGVGPGPMQTLRERYARPYTAKRGAIRNLKACQEDGSGTWTVNGIVPVTFEQVGK